MFIHYPTKVQHIVKLGGFILTERRSGTHILREYSLPLASGHQKGGIPIAHTHELPRLFEGIFSYCDDPVKVIGRLKCVVLQRRDMLRRAISNMIMNQTHQETSLKAKKRKPDYNFAAILDCLYESRMDFRTVNVYLSYYKCSRLFVSYEELCEDLNATVGKILDFLGIEQIRDVSFADVPIQKQADEITEAFVEQFCKDIGNISLTEMWQQIFRADKDKMPFNI